MTTTADRIENPFLVKVRVVGALVLREARVTFGSVKLGYFWAVAEPVIGTAILTMIFSYIARHPPIGTSFALFYATGIFTYQMYRKLAGSLMAVFSANRGLLGYPLVTELDVVFGRFILIFLTYIVIFTIFFTGLIVLGLGHFPRRFDIVLGAIAATGLLGLGVGLVNAVIVTRWPTWKRIEGILSRPLFFISGVFFLPSMFPPTLRYYMSWNPLLQAIDWMRVGYYSNYNSLVLDLRYLWICIGIFLVIGMGGERLYRKNRE
ncbi:ABC transporter permease [Stappia sp. ES.058]|uniref:ABC transporter permease n=1 Tax=Stappia sp. ES.058 TaxID=1881061 RepID=UPI00087D1E9D|nr:ABC transporter permease [Stappia sp. ES.058]SDT94938.1 capsular polysaccharide transport system permease protein [Stappia sp. ES.058]